MIENVKKNKFFWRLVISSFNCRNYENLVFEILLQKDTFLEFVTYSLCASCCNPKDNFLFICIIVAWSQYAELCNHRIVFMFVWFLIHFCVIFDTFLQICIIDNGMYFFLMNLSTHKIANCSILFFVFFGFDFVFFVFKKTHKKSTHAHNIIYVCMLIKNNWLKIQCK